MFAAEFRSTDARNPFLGKSACPPIRWTSNGTEEDDEGRLAGRRVFFDGVFKGDYSLALVNRNLARALLKNGVDLTLFCPEDGPGRGPAARGVSRGESAAFGRDILRRAGSIFTCAIHGRRGPTT